MNYLQHTFYLEHDNIFPIRRKTRLNKNIGGYSNEGHDREIKFLRQIQIKNKTFCFNMENCLPIDAIFND